MHIFRKPGFIANAAVFCVFLSGVAQGQTFSSTGSIAIPSGTGSTPASPYPTSGSCTNAACITVSGLAGMLQSLTLTLNYSTLETQSFLSPAILLQSPSGASLDLLSSGCLFGGTPPSSITFTLSDSGGSLFPPGTGNCPSPLGSSFLPTHYPATTADVFPTPGPSTYNIAGNGTNGTGTSTFANTFGTGALNGVWKLFVADRAGAADNTVISSWSLNFTVQPPTSTMTTVTGAPNPAITGTQATVTATVTASNTTVNGGSVTFVDGATSLGSVPVASGVAVLQTSTLAEGTHQITANYSGTTTGTLFDPSSSSYNQRIDNATVVSGSMPTTFCNPGSITVPGSGAALGAAGPYPSNIFVSNLPGTVDAVTVSLKSLTATRPDGFNSLLVGPGGSNLDFFSGAGGTGMVGPILLTFDDTATASAATLLTSGSFRPTSESAGDNYPACPPNATNCSSPPVGPPLPSSPFTPAHFAQTAGTAILGNRNAAGVFGGTSASTFSANGTWSLYLNETFSQANNVDIAGGWCLNFIENQVSVSATEAHIGSGASNHFVQGEQGAQFTLSITNNGAGPTGDPDGNHPLTVTDTLNSNFTFESSSGSGWSCSAAAQTVTCLNHGSIPQGNSYPTLTINVGVSLSATGSISNVASVSGGGAAITSTNTDSITIDPAPVLSVTKTHTGTFAAGQTAIWNITVSNTATGSLTTGTINVGDTLPTGYTLAGISGTGWSCPGSVGTGTVNCTSTQAVAGGASATLIQLTVNVPGNSPTLVFNTAEAWGGGDITHASSATAAVSNTDAVPVQVSVAITNITSTAANGSYGVGATIPINVNFNTPVKVIGTPLLALNSGGTASYASGSNTSTLTFSYTVSAGQNSSRLDETSTAALSLNGGTIQDTGGNNANLTLPAPGSVGSLSANKSIVIDTIAPIVVSYNVLFGSESFNVIGSTRNRLPWQITGIQVVFSKPIATANGNSLGGAVTATNISGLGTNTLTWTLGSPLTLGNFATTLAGSGANAIKDTAGNALAAGVGFSQNVKVLRGDFNDDGTVSASDLVLVNNARSQPYNIFADINGDGVVNLTDVSIVRMRIGTSLP